MSSTAVIIGIDGYATDPLTSAVNDALAFRDALVALKLVDDHVLLTSPVTPGAQDATHQKINQVLKEVHDRGSRADRLFFFYAGHGLSAYGDSARAVSETALIPPEVQDLSAEAALLINFDDFRHRLEKAGPAEQFYFFDACRDLVLHERPGNLPKLTWPASPEPSPGPTAQAALFSVSPGGRALGMPQGLGVMTSHVIDALHGRGLALDWSDDLDAYVVTAESITKHVRARVMATVGGQEGWRHQVMLPELRPTGGVLNPVQIVTHPPQPAFTLSFDPEGAAAHTTVELTLRGDPLREPRWPPCRHGEAVKLRPQVYRIVAQSDRGSVAADPPKIDLREVDRATIRIDDGGAPEDRIDTPAPGDAAIQSDGAERALVPGTGATVDVSADEPQATIELVGQDPPYRRWEGTGSLSQDGVPPGSYVVRFRLGPEVYSEAELDLVDGDTKHVQPGGRRSPLLAEAGAPDADGSIVLSETIGPMRTSVVATLLPMLGVLPFDATGELFQRLRPLVPALDIGAFEDRAVRVVVAVEGNGWSVPPREVAMGVTCELIAPGGVVRDVALVPVADGETGWGRMVHGTAAAPGRSFIVRLRSARLGTIELAAAALHGRVTVVGLAPTPDGRLDPVQHLLRVPGRRYNEPEPHIPYGRFLRELVLGQRLYEGGELLRRGAVPEPDAQHVRRGAPPEPDAQHLRNLLFAKWTDPILGCMAYYAWNDAVASGLPEQQGVAASNTTITAMNLVNYFGDLPDARVIAALAGLAGEPPLDEALQPGELPVLARTLHACAAGATSGRARRWASQVAPESTWTLVWRADPAATSLLDENVIATA